jgi:hypothetical protein
VERYEKGGRRGVGRKEEGGRRDANLKAATASFLHWAVFLRPNNLED